MGLSSARSGDFPARVRRGHPARRAADRRRGRTVPGGPGIGARRPRRGPRRLSRGAGAPGRGRAPPPSSDGSSPADVRSPPTAPRGRPSASIRMPRRASGRFSADDLGERRCASLSRGRPPSARFLLVRPRLSLTGDATSDVRRGRQRERARRSPSTVSSPLRSRVCSLRGRSRIG